MYQLVQTTAVMSEDPENKKAAVKAPEPPQKRRGRKSLKKAHKDALKEHAELSSREWGVTIQRDDKGRIMKGQVLNPGGRPKGVAEMIDALTGPMGKSCFEFLAAVVHGHEGAAPRERIDAAKILLDRRLGRAPEIVLAAQVPSEVVEATASLTREQLLAIASGDIEALPAGPVVDAEFSEATNGQSEEQSKKVT